MASVTAEMTDDDLETLSDGNTRMLTSLLGQRARLRDPVLDAYATAFDRWHALVQSGETDVELEQAYREVLRTLREIEVRGGF
jgi:hypothetical protein